MWNPYERYVVPALVSCACASKPIMKQREKIIPQARGVVAEFGCGAGTNFSYYDETRVERVIGIEPAPGMVERAKKSASRLDLPVEVIEIGGEGTGLPDASVDTAVFTFVLCTIPDWRAALDEARRIFRPDGQLLFSEHGLAPDAGVAKWQRRVEPVWKRLAGGCHLTRSTPDMLSAAGFGIDRLESMYLPSTPAIAGYCTWGQARPG
jgi:SAM-dependent methyltransferase